MYPLQDFVYTRPSIYGSLVSYSRLKAMITVISIKVPMYIFYKISVNANIIKVADLIIKSANILFLVLILLLYGNATLRQDYISDTVIIPVRNGNNNSIN